MPLHPGARKASGVIAQVRPFYDELIKTGFHCSEAVLKRILAEA